MTRYQSFQVVTVKELRRLDILHCGQTANRCVEWVVLEAVDGVAYVLVGGTKVKMTGVDIRRGLPMYRKSDCPLCRARVAKVIKKVSTPESKYISTRLGASDVPSVLSNVDNRRMGQGKPGGAQLRTPADLRNSLVRIFAERIMQKAKEKNENS